VNIYLAGHDAFDIGKRPECFSMRPAAGDPCRRLRVCWLWAYPQQQSIFHRAQAQAPMPAMCPPSLEYAKDIACAPRLNNHCAASSAARSFGAFLAHNSP